MKLFGVCNLKDLKIFTECTLENMNSLNIFYSELKSYFYRLFLFVYLYISYYTNC